ncbi:MAG TPA: glycoside hydrolase family 172 protein [Terriglobia bacterium]|nr:glycoside hydrolase family 172 protein [Terriglobia bacterium]
MTIRTAICGLGFFLLLHATRQTSVAQSLFTLPQGVETRWASPENPGGEKGKAAQTNAGRKGKPAIPLKAGEQVVLAEVRGASGTVRRIWATISDRSPAMLRGLKIEMFWDGSTKPAVSAPFGDFFGQGSGHMSAFESALFASPEARSFNCYVPMPFRSGMKIVLSNESGKDLQLLFYDVDYTLGDDHGPEDLYFHAYFRRENPTSLQRDFEILPQVHGKGRFLGTSLCVLADTQKYVDKWWGEGEVKVYLDGDSGWPTLAGTGTEDYIGTGWGIQRAYADLYQGSPSVDSGKMQFCFYRFHIPDPIYFRADARVTIQQIGFNPEHPASDPLNHTGAPIYKAGPGLVERKKGEFGTFERQDDWSSVAYFYLDKPDDDLPPIDTPEQRMKGLGWGGPYFGDVQ